MSRDPLPQIGMMMHMEPAAGEPIPAFFAQRAAHVAALEALGVDAVWVTEHHFDPRSLSASPLLLLAQWAARTQRIHLGVAAVLAAGRNPALLAEDIALLSNLAPGRIALGFAKGGPFEAQSRAFGWGSEQARQEMLAVVDAVRHHLLGQGSAAAPLQPPLQPPLPLFIASRDPDALAWAAARGIGWMSAQFWSLDMYDAQAINWSIAAQHPQPDALLVRGLWLDDDADAARDHALRWLHTFRASKEAQWKVGFRGPLAELDETDSLQRMIVGTPAQCAAQLGALLATRRVPRLAFNPMHPEPQQQLAQMRRLLHEVLPAVTAAATSPCA
jgi:alkanesulfonate monooxygenase SsuD/methylene tetrahydromethanopterin reductase-like flavin-dependent oxidoreductase (luciferase family)